MAGLLGGAAKVLLSRLYLAQERWVDAATVLRSVIDSGIYELDRRNGEDSYEKLFQIGGEYSPEIIFCIMGIKDLYTNSRYQYLYPEAAYGGWHQFSPYNELVKEYFVQTARILRLLRFMMRMILMLIGICVCMLLFFYLLWEVMRELSIMI